MKLYMLNRKCKSIKKTLLIFLLISIILLVYNFEFDETFGNFEHGKTANTDYSNIPTYPKKWLINDKITFLKCLVLCKNVPSSWTVVCIVNKDEVTDYESLPNCLVISNTSNLEPYKFDTRLPFNINVYLFAIQNGAKYIKTLTYQYVVDLDHISSIINFKELSKSSIFVMNQDNDDDGDDDFKLDENNHETLKAAASAAVSSSSSAAAECNRIKLCENLKQSASLFIASSNVNIHCFSLLEKFTSISTGQNNLITSDTTLLFGYSGFLFLPLESLLKADLQLSCLAIYVIKSLGGFVEVYRERGAIDLEDGEGVENVPLKSEKICKDDVEEYRKCLKGNYNLTRCLTVILSRFLEKSTLTVVKSWLKMLKSISYPLRIDNRNIDHLGTCSEIVLSTLKVDELIEMSLSYTYDEPVVRSVVNIRPINEQYSKVCQKEKKREPIDFTNPWLQRQNIILIIIFNNPHYEIISILELLYRPFYPNIYYCGPKEIDTRKYPQLEGFKTSFLTFDIQPEKEVKGALNYQCTLKVMKMQHIGVAGYLAISDDLILLHHQLQYLTTESIWFLPKKEIRIGDLENLKECRLGLCDFFNRWSWWEIYQKQGLDVLKSLPMQPSENLRSCGQKITAETGGKNRILGAYSDIYFVPSGLANEFVEIGEFFLNRGLFLEIAIPNIVLCLSGGFDNTSPLSGLQIWDAETRDFPWTHFKKSKLFARSYFHPIKWSFYYDTNDTLANESEGTASLIANHSLGGQNSKINTKSLFEDLLCDKLLKYLYDPLGRLPE